MRSLIEIQMETECHGASSVKGTNSFGTTAMSGIVMIQQVRSHCATNFDNEFQQNIYAFQSLL